MKRSILGLLQFALLLSWPMATAAQTIELQAISDFTNRESGAVPYYLEIAGGRNALAINAANPDYRDQFARAEHEYIGPDGIYDITINALGEIDGDGTYRLLVNGIVQGVAVNSPVEEDYTVIPHTFQAIALTAPVTIAVESNAVSNNTIPEGDGFAFARGRWRSVVIEAHQSDAASTMAVELGLSMSTIETLIQQGSRAPIVLSVVNNAPSTTATAPVVTIALPEGIGFSSSESCTEDASGVRCLLPELAPGEVYSTSFSADIQNAGWLSISGAVVSDQTDTDLVNNTASLSFESANAAIVDNETDSTSNSGTSSPTITTDADNNDSPTNQSVNQNSMDGTATDANSGAMEVPTLLMLLAAGLFRARRKIKATTE